MDETRSTPLAATQTDADATRGTDHSSPALPISAAPLVSVPAMTTRLGITTDHTPRYAIGAKLGHGATSQVWAVEDRDLARVVALKEVQAKDPVRQLRFLHEAASAASLDHPNVPPIYDIGLTDGGAPFYTMKRISGRSLGAAIHAWAADPAAAPSMQERISLVIQVAHALEAAHARGLLHRDVKPDNIMLGTFGEVFLVDWGTAASSESATTTRAGTPLYMSPEAARGDITPTPGDDIYSLGASLFHVMLLRPPLLADQAEAFWARKAAGHIDMPRPAERAGVPRALLAIALCAIASDPAQRYVTVAALRTDLMAWLAGDPVRACPENPWERFRRWHRRHGHVLWTRIAVVAIVTVLAMALIRERGKSVASWGAPVVAEDFTNDVSWRTRWDVQDGEAHAEHGHLVTSGRLGTRLLCRQRFDGPLAIEYKAEIQPRSHPCDLSLIFYTDASETAGKIIPRGDTYLVQLGAFDGSYSTIALDDGVHFQHLDWSAFAPQPGVTYQVRIEIVDTNIRVLVDGRELMRHDDVLPFTGGWLALYGFYAGKSFSQVRIHALGTPERLGACAIGDAFSRARDHGHAALEYHRVARSHPGTAIGDEAAYKQGVSTEALGDHAAADAAWAQVRSSHWKLQVALANVDRLVAAGDDAAAIAAVRVILDQAPRTLHRRIAQAWNRWTLNARDATRERCAAWLSLREQRLANETCTDYVAAECLLWLGRPDEVLARHPLQQDLCAQALAALGANDRVVAEYSKQRWRATYALVDMGRGNELAERYPEQRKLLARSYVEHGRFDDAMQVADDDAEILGWIALVRGGAAQLRDHPLPVIATTACLFEHDAAAALVAAGTDAHLQLAPLLALQRFDEAQHAAQIDWAHPFPLVDAARSLADPQTYPWRQPAAGARPLKDLRAIRAAWLLTPIALGAAADWPAAFAALREYRWILAQRPWFWAGYLDSTLDAAAFLAQPYALTAPAELQFLTAVLAERSNDHTAARAAWAAWLAIPVEQRGCDPDPVLEAFARWRCQ